MAFLEKEDLKTHLYADVIEEITRADDDIIDRCISSAVAEVKSYLSRYDLLKLFGSDTVDAEVESEHLNNLVKDVACWYLVRLANPNVNIPLFRTAYEDAIKFLEKVMKGQADPDGWPYKADDTDTTANESNGVQFSSNTKRIQHF